MRYDLFMSKTGLSIMKNHCRQAAFTLLEVLITLIILSIGLLGLAGLQTMSLRNNHSAYLRSQATSQIYDIVDRMRANTDQVNNSYVFTESKYTFDEIGQQTNDCDKKAGCSAAQMAEHDLFNWKQAIRGALPQGIGIICRDSSMEDGAYALASDEVTTSCTNLSTDPLVIKIWWVDDRTGDTPVATRFSTTIGDRL